MDLIVIILTLCLSLSLMLTPSASQQIHVQSSYHTIPRKLRLLEEVKVNAGSAKEKLASHDKLRGSFAGKQPRKESGKVDARVSGTMQEWKEGIDPSEFFTMDYTHVTRRRPIHNKSLPVGP